MTVHTRFIDRQDQHFLLKASRDFRLREHGSFILWLSSSFIFAILALAIFITYVLGEAIYPTNRYIPFVEITDVSIAFVFCVMLLLAAYVVIVIRRVRFIVQATEFQCMTFSNAMRVDALFCLIANADKMVIYTDEHMVDLFWDDELRSIDEVLTRVVEYPGITKKEREKLVKAIDTVKPIEVPFTLTDSDGKKHKAVLKLDVLKKPQGYFTIRAYPAGAKKK